MRGELRRECLLEAESLSERGAAAAASHFPQKTTRIASFEKPNGSRRIGSTQRFEHHRRRRRGQGFAAGVCGCADSEGPARRPAVVGGRRRVARPARHRGLSRPMRRFRRAWHAVSGTALGHDPPGASGSQGEGLTRWDRFSE